MIPGRSDSAWDHRISLNRETTDSLVFELPVRRLPDRVLLQIEHGACDKLALVAGEIERGHRYVARRKQSSPWARLDRFFKPIFSPALFNRLHVLFIGRQRPADVELI